MCQTVSNACATSRNSAKQYFLVLREIAIRSTTKELIKNNTWIYDISPRPIILSTE